MPSQFLGRQIKDDTLTGADVSDFWGLWDENDSYGPTGTVTNINQVLWKGNLYKLNTSVTTNTTVGEQPDTTSDWVLLNTQSISSTTTANSRADVILVNSSTGPITLTIPEISTLSSSKKYVVKDTANSKINNITIQPSGSDTIDSETSLVINSTKGFCVLQVTGSTNWSVISKNSLEQDIQVATTTANIQTTANAYVDMPGATLTTAGVKTKDYEIRFSGRQSHSSNADRVSEYIININGLDQASSENATWSTTNNDPHAVNVSFTALNIAPGIVIKVRWKTENNTLTLLNGNFSIRGLG